MVDDKDDQNPDPWAGIDGSGDPEPAGDFSFSFDSSEPIESEEAQPFPDLAPELPASIPDVGVPDEDDQPIIRIEAAADAAEQEAAESHEDDPFASLAFDQLGDEDGDEPLDVDATEAEATGAEATGADVGDDVAGWLEEPDVGETPEPPLAVFPSDAEAEAVDPFAGVSGVFEENASPFAGIDDGHVHAADATQEASAAESSFVEIGTGQSGIVSPSDVDAGSGGVPLEDWTEASMDEPLEPDAEGDDAFAESIGFGAAEEVTEMADDGLATVGAVAAPLATRKPAGAGKRARGGGLGQIVGIVAGGLMALPITYAILVWGFQKDPFKFTKMVPEQVAFLLPEKFQPGYKKPGPLSGASALDNLPVAASEGAAETPPTEPDEKTPAEPAEETAATPADAPAAPAKEQREEMADDKGKDKDDDLFPEPEAAVATQERMPQPDADVAKPPMPAAAEPPDFEPEPSRQPPVVAAPEPEPLDFTGLEKAIAEAQDSFEGLADAGADEQVRNKRFVTWYKRLAEVAEQLVMLETAAADSGRPLEQAPEQMTAVIDSIAVNDDVMAKLSTLSGMWLTSKKRLADGAVLLATFEGARQVGPYWSSRVTLDGAEPKGVAVISRQQPVASEGERVLVTGVLFDGDVVWAADCRRLAKPAAPVEDLF